uniref:Uncharacterized protein n=1 Tax=Arundo donax TaxID=35708 RepID=A0A0A9BN54_ARUDO
MKGRAHMQLDPGETEQFGPECAGEHDVAVADDRAGKTMKPHDVVKEGAGD